MLGYSKSKKTERLNYLRQQLQQLQSGLSTGNADAGVLVLDTYCDENELEAKLIHYVGAALGTA